MEFSSPGQTRTPALSALALYLSVAGAVALPALALLLAAVFGGSGGWTAAVSCLVLGGIAVAVSTVLAIVALVKRVGSRTHAVVGLVLGILGLPALAASAAFSFLLTANALHGRPHRVGGRPRRTGTRSGGDWSDDGPRPDVDRLEAAVRSALADAWLADASLEHASIAAFGSLALDLVALGAPPDLIRRSHAAAIDEVAHAEACFALASAYAGTPLTAAAFPEAQAPRVRETSEERLRRVAVESAVDGCIGEGAAAAVAAEMSRCAVDPVVAGVLARIAREEQRHADLAWSVLSWCLCIGEPGLRDVVVGVLAQEESGGPPPERAPVDLTSHGRADGAVWQNARSTARDRVRVQLTFNLSMAS